MTTGWPERVERLFDADRASLITRTVLDVVKEFHLDLVQLHNDSTTLTLSGDYPEADGFVRGGQQTPAITHGHNKDHRPDLKQLLCILTVSRDGAVPVAFRVMSGNTVDDVTHIPTWDGLVELVGHSRFLYVADAKLCSSKAMGHINAHEGRFVTVVPHGRREDVWFRDWVQTHAPEWVEAKVKPGGQNEPDSIWRVFEAPLPSGDGYRVIWVHSSAKHVRDAAARSSRLEKGLAAIEQLEVRLAGPKSRFKTRVAVEEAATSALKDVRAGRWISFDVEEAPSATFHQVRRGRPGPDTRYVRKERPTFHVRAEVRGDVIAFDAATDGCFALVTNDRNLSGVQVLEAYHYQPHLERRHHLLKSAQEMAPMHLENPERIEALLFCHFFALLTEALVEREIRTSMKEQNLSGIALYPELRNCPAPSAPRIFEVFAGLQRHYLMDGDDIAQTFEPELSLVQQQVLELLNVPADVYQSATTD